LVSFWSTENSETLIVSPQDFLRPVDPDDFSVTMRGIFSINSPAAAAIAAACVGHMSR
jgi:hypothetical protein